MAGIGFHLQKILKKDTYLSVAQAYIYSALLSSGPWLLSIIGISLIGIVLENMVPSSDHELFRVVVVYTYMGTLILTGPFQLATTRYLADRLYVNDPQSLLPSFQFVSTLVFLLGGGVSFLFYKIAGFSYSLSIASALLFQMVSLTWVGMIYLSAARDYVAIVVSFFIGYTVAVILSYWGGINWGLEGMLWGFAGGMTLLALLLSIRTAREFPSSHSMDKEVMAYWYSKPWLLLCGFSYNAGIWIDKVCFWVDRDMQAGPFLATTNYDTCMYYAYVSIVPTMALFLIRIETSFYTKYAEYYRGIEGGFSWRQLEHSRKEMNKALRLSILRLIKFQGSITLVCILLAPQLMTMTGLNPGLATMFRIALIAAFMQALLMVQIILILYFDWQRLAAVIATIFFIANTVLTPLSIKAGYIYAGFGYLVACLLAVTIGILCMEKKLKNLDYAVFAGQQVRG